METNELQHNKNKNKNKLTNVQTLNFGCAILILKYLILCQTAHTRTQDTNKIKWYTRQNQHNHSHSAK